jgi:hypothetical protein
MIDGRPSALGKQMPLSWHFLGLGVGGFELARAVELEDRVDADLSDSLWGCGLALGDS